MKSKTRERCVTDMSGGGVTEKNVMTDPVKPEEWSVTIKNLAQTGYNTGHFVWLSLLVGLLIYNLAFQSLFLIWNGLLFIIWLSIFAL